MDYELLPAQRPYLSSLQETPTLMEMADGNLRRFYNFGWDGSEDRYRGRNDLTKTIQDFGYFSDSYSAGDDIVEAHDINATEAITVQASDDSDDDVAFPVPQEMTKKEQRAMDREIPWRDIVKGDEEVKQAFVAAVKK